MSQPGMPDPSPFAPPPDATGAQVTDSPLVTTVYGGRHAAGRVLTERDPSPVPGAGSLGLLAHAVVAVAVGLAVEFNALPVPHAVDALWIPIACLVSALLAGFAGVRLRFGSPTDAVVGLAAAGVFGLGGVVVTVGVDARGGVLAVVWAVIVAGVVALESTTRR